MGKLPTQTYFDIYSDKNPFEALRSSLKLKSLKTRQDFHKKHAHAVKILKNKNVDLEKIRQRGGKIAASSALAGALFLVPPTLATKIPPPEVVAKKGETTIAVSYPKIDFVKEMAKILPEKADGLTRDQEKTLEQLFKNVLGVKSKATLEGEHLNSTYGLIGAEQHLYRFPGDTISEHGEGDVLNEGIAPGLGAWGYFAPSKAQLTKTLENDEKWYAVVQTLYLPDWNTRTAFLRDWYKYRKVLIVNTVNGNAVVADIADSGPAKFTGKIFGGSPEVMTALGGIKYKKGPVVLFFVDDPQNQVPLGPVEYNKLNLADVTLKQI
ncbi:MAG: hypothetical protein HY044_01970 [Candidatus Woesebacteria bacterium]|nr:MAG: hypothetical protein HY044_01970 [Candidatus Woesebacteria bacterium]